MLNLPFLKFIYFSWVLQFGEQQTTTTLRGVMTSGSGFEWVNKYELQQ